MRGGDVYCEAGVQSPLPHVAGHYAGPKHEVMTSVRTLFSISSVFPFALLSPPTSPLRRCLADFRPALASLPMTTYIHISEIALIGAPRKWCPAYYGYLGNEENTRTKSPGLASAHPHFLAHLMPRSMWCICQGVSQKHWICKRGKRHARILSNHNDGDLFAIPRRWCEERGQVQDGGPSRDIVCVYTPRPDSTVKRTQGTCFHTRLPACNFHRALMVYGLGFKVEGSSPRLYCLSRID